MLPIAVDAMGGDNAPGAIVAGARRAVDELGIPVVLVGRWLGCMTTIFSVAFGTVMTWGKCESTIRHSQDNNRVFK